LTEDFKYRAGNRSVKEIAGKYRGIVNAECKDLWRK
jgi:hypothetical protein